jgi:hypothetical protein
MLRLELSSVILRRRETKMLRLKLSRVILRRHEKMLRSELKSALLRTPDEVLKNSGPRFHRSHNDMLNFQSYLTDKTTITRFAVQKQHEARSP